MHSMSDGEAEPDIDAVTEAATPAARSLLHDDDASPPPARPSMSDDRPPPVLRKVPPPGPVKVGRVLWILSFLLGGAAVLIAFLSGEGLMTELTEALGRLAPGYSAEEVEALVDVIYWSSLGALGLVIAIEAVLLAMIMNQRGGVRWVQLPVLIVHGAAALVATASLAIGEWGVAIALLLIAGLAVAFAGWVLLLFPRAHRWFRMKDQTEPVPID